ncbi:MAG TPA: hypothetical protein VGT78_08800 [Rhizomicrobium sp.]|nr:hypothetical protein [Rhizomicrobium sp.]
MNTNVNASPTIRWKLLSTVSALALLASAYAASDAEAAGTDADRPLIWIELGGQAENISGQGEVFAPDFLAKNSTSPVLGHITPLQAQKPPKFSFGEEGKISFEPEDSNWIFSASVRIGRSGNSQEVDHQTNGFHYFKYHNGHPTGPTDNIRGTSDFSDTNVRHKETHAILDFSAGKDLGLGMFGKHSSSEINIGVRFAQFASRSTFDVRARPDLHVKYATNSTFLPSNTVLTVPLLYFHTYHATAQASRSFRGVGPSLSWNASAPFLGDLEDGEATLDWGVNASVLFGKQKARVQHHESGHYKSKFQQFQGIGTGVQTYSKSGGHSAARSVMVPNVGGFAGLSYRYADAKMSLGYRADFFLGAIDGGIDASRKETLGFKGPFASISIGLGD